MRLPGWCSTGTRSRPPASSGPDSPRSPPSPSSGEVAIGDGRLQVLADTPIRRFVRRLQQCTFSGAYARSRGQQVHYVTERAVFRLTDDGLLLTEIAPGVDLERDVLAHMDLAPDVAPDLREMDLREMDPRIFSDEPMGLSRDSLVDLDDCLVHHPEDNVLYVNLEGLHLGHRRAVARARSPPGPAAGDPRPPRPRRRQLRQPRTRPFGGRHLLLHDPRQHREAFPQHDALLDDCLLPPPARRALHRSAARSDHLSHVRSGPGRNP